jgi:hypothetical protein
MNIVFHLLFLSAWVGSLVLFPSVSRYILWAWSLVFLLVASRFAHFSRKRKAKVLQAAGYGLVAALHYPLFVWRCKAQLQLFPEEQRELLSRSTKRTQVSRPSSLLCPFCRVEIEGVLVALPGGGIGVRKRPVLCPRCQTRLDSCRFCLFFEPGRESFSWGQDMTSGRCSVLKKYQPVEEICNPQVARKLKEMGWHTLYAGLAIPDAFEPPSACRSFQFDEKKTLLERLPCMGRERFLLLRLEEEFHSQSSSSSRSG